MSNSAIEVDNLVKIYRPGSRRPVRALDGISLRVRRGEIFGLLGRNGAGKTTLLKVLTTLIPPTSGTASILGCDVTRQPLEVRQSICVVLQENAVELFLSVRDNLMTYARFHGLPLQEIRQRAERAIARFSLEEYVDQKVIDLSGGLKRRVQVAKVFMVDKPIVFLDEATTGMDPLNKRTTIEAFREEATRGRTIFLTTHILQEAEELCDTIAIVENGRCLASGDLRTIKGMVTHAVDVTITFASLNDAVLEQLRSLPLLKLSHSNNTVEACIRGSDLAALEVITRIARTHPILHLEVNSATLEDVFVELLRSTQPGQGIP